MNTSRKGNGKEVRTALLFEADGCVAGLRRNIAGPADVLAFDAHDKVLVEVKATADGPYKNFGPSDRSALRARADAVGARPLLAWWAPRAKTHRLIEAWEWPS